MINNKGIFSGDDGNHISSTMEKALEESLSEYNLGDGPLAKKSEVEAVNTELESTNTQLETIMNPSGATEGQVLTWSGTEASYEEAQGGITIDSNHFFADNTERNAYFVSNPSELVEGIYISVGDGYQQYDGSVWIDKTALIDSSKASQQGLTIYRSMDKPRFGFLMDDGRDRLYQQIIDNLDPVGIPATIVYPFALYDDQLSVDQLKAIIAKGGEVINHGNTSASLTGSPTSDVAYKEIVTAKKRLESVGIRVDGFLPAGGGIDTDLIPKYVSPNYSYAFCNYSGDLVDTSKDLYNLNRIDLKDGLTANVQTKIDTAFANNGLLFFYCHGIGTDTLDVTTAELAAVIAYMDGKGADYEWVTARDGVAAISNIATKENIRIGLKDDDLKFYGPNLYSTWENYGRTGSGLPVNWRGDTTNLTGAVTPTIEKTNVAPQINLNFNSSNQPGDFYVIENNRWIGNVEERAAGYFSLGWELGRNDITVSVDLYNGGTLVENLLTFTSDELNSANTFSKFFFLRATSQASNIRTTITITADAATWVAKLREPVLKLSVDHQSSTRINNYYANVFSLADDPIGANTKEKVALDDTTNGYSNMDWDSTLDTLAPYDDAFLEIRPFVQVSGASSGTDITISVETTEGKVFSKTYTPSAATQVFQPVFTGKFVRNEKMTLYTARDGSTQHTVLAGSGLIVNQIA